MPEQQIENFIADVLSGDAKKNALEFASYLRASEMQFERGIGYWEGKLYIGVLVFLIKRNIAIQNYVVVFVRCRRTYGVIKIYTPLHVGAVAASRFYCFRC